MDNIHEGLSEGKFSFVGTWAMHAILCRTVLQPDKEMMSSGRE
jgi:hypothetical protein